MKDEKNNDKNKEVDEINKGNSNNENELTKPLIISEETKNLGNQFINNNQELSIEYLPENSTNYDISVKVILLGDSNVGKSSIVNCLQQDTNLQRKTISLELYNYIIKINSIVIRMQIWDTVGQEKFNSITTNYYKTTDVVIFVYAINDINSFNNLNNWYNEFNDKGNRNDDDNNNDNEEKKEEDEINNNKNKLIIRVLVGNKKDKEKERQVTYEQGKKFGKEKNFDIFEEIKCNLNEILDESSYLSYKDNNNNSNIKENIDDKIEKIENKNNSFDDNDKDKDKDCVKQLFDRIGKEIYKQYLNNIRNRLNSSNYDYEASKSMLEVKEEKEKEKENNSTSCCC